LLRLDSPKEQAGSPALAFASAKLEENQAFGAFSARVASVSAP
jgi:hypothetical protein